MRSRSGAESNPKPPAPLTQPAAPALIVLAAGVCAALHVGKLAPAVPALQQALGMSLVQAGFLLSLVQGAGMALGLAVGAACDGLGARRSMLMGLVLLALASIAGAFAQDVGLLMALRVIEGMGFLLVVLPVPGLLREQVAAQELSRMLGLWGAYMPLATALVLLVGPLIIASLGWRAWWGLLGAMSGAMALWLALGVPTPPARPSGLPSRAASRWSSVRRTLQSAGPWWVAATFATYSAQWLAVIGFLPTIYAAAGVSGAAMGPLTAVVAAANIAGNVAAGRALQRGVSGPRLLSLGFAAMALASVLAFAPMAHGASPWLSFVALMAFSGMGGLIPGTLFAMSLRVAPGPDTVATTVGWLQQWSSMGQFIGPPIAAWLAVRAGGWHASWQLNLACCALGLLLSAGLARHLARGAARLQAQGSVRG